MQSNAMQKETAFLTVSFFVGFATDFYGVRTGIFLSAAEVVDRGKLVFRKVRVRKGTEVVENLRRL